MFNNITTFFLFVLLSFVAGVAVAGTPDGDTPATEEVCDDLKGGTPGLYGLCVAYCEAQDLDDDEFNQKPSNEKLLNVYNKKKKLDDPAMPCKPLPCDCLPGDPMFPNCDIPDPDECDGTTPI